MGLYKNQIEEIVYEQKKMLEKYTAEREECLEGNLARCMNQGKKIYYHTYSENGKYVRTTIGQEPDKIRSLARREYLSASIKILENNIAVLEKAEKRLLVGDMDSVRAMMQKAYRELPDEYFFSGRIGSYGSCSLVGAEEAIGRHIGWANEPFEQSTYKPEGRRFPTSAGFKVRSKSEQHIVEQMVNYGIPFRYEQVIHIADRIFSSDFTFRDRYLELFYWEHAGMMNDPYYCRRHKQKMEIYERAGIVPWKNLIVTYDVDDVINVPLVKSIIENEVIPRL